MSHRQRTRPVKPFTEPDPAARSAFGRWFYRNRRPTWLGHWVSDWVHNLEAAHGEAMIAHGGAQRVRLVPVPPEERAPILQEYVRVASSGRKHFPLPSGPH